MKISGKYVRLCVVGVVLLMLLTLTGVGSAGSAEKVRLTVAIAVNGKSIIENAIHRFEADHPNVDVELSVYAWKDIHDRLVVGYTGGEPFDVAYAGPAWIVEFAEAGWIEPLDNRVTWGTVNKTFSGLIKGLTYKGHIWAQPLYAGAVIFLYNSEVLKKAGLSEFPHSWEEFIAVAADLMKKGVIKYGMAFPEADQDISDYKSFTAILHSLGGSYFDEEGNVVFYKNGGLEALKLYDRLFNELKIADPASKETMDYDIYYRSLADGEYLAILGWPYYYGWARRNLKNGDKLRLALIPGGRGVRSGSWGYGQSFTIAKECKHKDLAWELIQYLTSDEVQKARALEGADLPATMALYDDPEMRAALPDLDIFLEQYKYASDEPLLPWFADFELLIMNNFQAVINDRVTPEEGAKAIQEGLEQYKAKYGYP